MNRILLLISAVLMLTFVSCSHTHQRKMYKTTDGKGYCYQDDDTLLWYYIYMNELTGKYEFTTSTEAPSYDASSTYSVELNADNTTGYSESFAESMSESTGEATGGSEASESSSSESDSSGMSESTGESTGGSDSSSDAGGGDSGGGDGGGGGE